MAISIDPVRAGDLITADLFNKMILKISEGSGGGAPPGSVVVPSIFGQNLHDAAGILGQPALGLNVGVTLDPFGKALDPDLPDSQDRIVLMQSPAAGAYAMPGSAVDMLLSAKTGGGGPPTPKVEITGFSRDKVPVKQDVVILGENFDPDRNDNVVTFDGIPTATPGLQSTDKALFVFVPEGIPGAPILPGQEKTVTVRVEANATSDSKELVILAPLAGENPSITNLTTTTGVASHRFSVGDTIVINGANFDSTAEANQIIFRSGGQDTEATLIDGQPNTSSKLFVVAPELPGHASTPTVGASLSVTVNVGGVDRKSNSVNVVLVFIGG